MTVWDLNLPKRLVNTPIFSDDFSAKTDCREAIISYGSDIRCAPSFRSLHLRV